MQYGFGEYAVIFKALSDETRLRIITMLKNGKTCACKILEEFNFTQPTLSYHMKQLTDSILVDAQKEGKWVYYSINQERLNLITNFITELNTIQNFPKDCCKE